MNIYLIVGMIDEGYSFHYIIQGKDILEAIIEQLKKDPEDVMGWDFKDYLSNEKIAFSVNDQSHIAVKESILRDFCKDILVHMFESRVDGDSNAGYAIFDITSPIDTFVVKEEALNAKENTNR